MEDRKKLDFINLEKKSEINKKRGLFSFIYL